VLAQLAPNNYNVQAYYLPKENGEIGEVYLYQNDVYLCTAVKIAKFTTAQAEWTSADDAAMTEQAKYISNFDREIKVGRESKITRVTTVDADWLDKIIGEFNNENQGDKNVVKQHYAEKYTENEDLDELIEEYTIGVRELAFECV
jgi:hypothetical protein